MWYVKRYRHYERVADCTRTKLSKGFLHPSVSRVSVLHANQPQICNTCPNSTSCFGRCTPLFISISRLIRCLISLCELNFVPVLAVLSSRPMPPCLLHSGWRHKNHRSSKKYEHTMCILYHEFFPSHGATVPSEPEPPYYRGFTITLKTHHTRQE